MIELSDYLILGAIVFALSVAGIFINRKNVIILLMCVELMLLAVNMNFVAFSHFLGDTVGQVFVFFILTLYYQPHLGQVDEPFRGKKRGWGIPSLSSALVTIAFSPGRVELLLTLLSPGTGQWFSFPCP